MASASATDVLRRFVDFDVKREPNQDMTTYVTYPKTKDGHNSNYLMLASNTKAIIEALQNLYEKIARLELEQLQSTKSKSSVIENNDRVLVEALRTNRHDAFPSNVDEASKYCDVVESKLRDILRTVGSNEVKKEVDRKTTTTAKKDVVQLSPATIRNIKKPAYNLQGSIKRFRPSTYEKKSTSASRVPFVTAGIANPSFSVIANMQMLINLLKMYNPYTEVVADPSFVTDEILAIVYSYLKEIISCLRDHVGFLAIEMVSLNKIAHRLQDADRVSDINGRIFLLKRQHENLVPHIRDIMNIKKQVWSVRRGIQILKDNDKELKENFKLQKDQVLSQCRQKQISRLNRLLVHDKNHPRKNYHNYIPHSDAVELLKCIHKLRLLLKL